MNLIDKIKKLLELASTERNPSAQEAESAMAKVQELLAKYELEMADVESVGRAQPEGFERIGDIYFTRKSPQDRFIIWLLEHHFHVHVINEGCGLRTTINRRLHFRWNLGFDKEHFGRRRHTFFGKATNVAVARHVFHYLHGEFERQWKVYRKGSGDRNQCDFYRGLYEGLSYRLTSEEKRHQKTATPAQRDGLIRREREDSDALCRFVEEIHEDFFRRRQWRPRFQVPDPPNREAVAAGHKAARTINIRPAVNESKGTGSLPSMDRPS